MAKTSLDPKKGAALWQERFDKAKSNQTKLFKRFADWYDSLYAVVGNSPAPWRSKVYLPVLARQAWALISKFLTLSPGFEVRDRGSETGLEQDDTAVKLKAEKAQRKLEYDYDNPDMDESVREKLYEPLVDAVVTGTGIAKVCWTVKNHSRYERMVDENGYADLTQEVVYDNLRGYNDLEPVNIFNVFVSPAAGSNIYKAPWIIIKEIKTIAELKKVNEGRGVKIYMNLEQLDGKTTSVDDQSPYNAARNRLLNQQDKSDDTVDMVTIYECYEGEMIYTYADTGSNKDDKGWVLIREQKNPYWHGRYPLVKFHVKKRPFSFFGEGLFEVTYRIQAAYNDVFNHYMDALNVSTDPMIIAHEKAELDDYVIEPAGVVTWRGDQKPEQFKHAEPNPAQLQLVLTQLDQAIEGVTISQYASGVPNSSTDKTQGTATGILRLQEAAGDLVSFFRTNFKASILQVGKMYLSNNQQFMQEPMTLMVTNKSKIEPMKITPADMQGDMSLTIDDASMEPATKEEQRNMYIAFVSQFLALKQASDTQSAALGTEPLAADFYELTDGLADKFGLKNFDKFLLTPEEVKGLQDQQMLQSLQLMQQAGVQPMQTPPAMPQQGGKSNAV